MLDSSKGSKKALLLDALNEAMTTLLSRKSAQSSSVSAYLHKLKLSYKLDIDEFDLLHKAYERAVLLINADKVTYTANLVAYLKKIAFNIAREQRRQTVRCSSLNEEICSKAYPGSVDISDELNRVTTAMSQLDDQEKLLLHLRIIEQKSWKDICELWKQEYSEDVSITVLRKRKQRALVRLRHLYHGSVMEAGYEKASH